jgi:MbtH protein
MEAGEKKAVYEVVVGHEGRHSLWPADHENPLGWADAGRTGTQQECLEYIKSVESKREVEHPAPEQTGGERGDL